jgi:hypothetical protein
VNEYLMALSIDELGLDTILMSKTARLCSAAKLTSPCMQRILACFGASDVAMLPVDIHFSI